MAQKSLGFVELEWTCKSCGTKNPGMQKTCLTCGSPMPPEVEFELAAEQKLLDDKKKLEAAQQGADTFCPYCGTRNAAGAGVCIQCGGDLKTGKVRQSGQVIGGFQPGPAPEISCPFCNEKIQANVQRCPKCGGDLTRKAAEAAALKPPLNSPPPASIKAKTPIWMIVSGIILLLLCCCAIGVFAFFSTRTTDKSGQVESVSWQRSIEIMEIRPVNKSDWQDSLPSEAKNVSCSEKLRETSNSPAPNSREVCGEPYTVDKGNGSGEVVQDCKYEIYAQYCSYTVPEWQVVDSAQASGSDLYPTWPILTLRTDQREGGRSESYEVNFSADGQIYPYNPSSESEFSQFDIGSTWTLKVNTFGAVNQVVP